MTEALISLMNAPRRVQSAVALGLLAAVVLAAVGSLLFLAGVIRAKADNIAMMREELYRLEAVIARRPPDAMKVSTPHGGDELLFVEGESLAAIQAKLQERVNALAGTSGAIVTSISGTPRSDFEGATYVGVRADVEGSLQAVHELVRQVEISQPPLIIRQASLRTTNAISQGILAEPLQLAGQFLILGAIDPQVTVGGTN